MLRQTEKVIIACYLLAEGLDGKSIAGLLDALEQGIAAKEQDALQMREEFRVRPIAGLPVGILGEVVAGLKALDDLQEQEEQLEVICRDLGLLKKLVSTSYSHDLAARIALRRIAELAEGSRRTA